MSLRTATAEIEPENIPARTFIAAGGFADITHNMHARAADVQVQEAATSVLLRGDQVAVTQPSVDVVRLTNLTGADITVVATMAFRTFAAGASAQFQVDAQGNLVRVNNVPMSWPVAQGSAGEVLTNDGTGNLTWGTAGGMVIGNPVVGGTVGSLLYVGAGGLLAQDNTYLFWDETNKRLGFGTSAPITTMHQARTDPGPLQYFGRLTLTAAATGNSFTDCHVQTYQSGGTIINLALIRAYADGFPGLATYSNQPADGAAQLILRAGNTSGGRVLFTCVNNSGNPPVVVFSNGNAGKSAYDEFMIVQAFGQTCMGTATVGFGGTAARLTVNNNVGGEDILALGQGNIERARFTAAGVLLFQQDGSAGAALIALGNDPNTGLYHPAADELAVTTGGTQRVRWTSNEQNLNTGQKVRRTAQGAGVYNVLVTDYIIAKTAITGGGDAVNLPAAATAGAGKVFIVKDESGGAVANNITITPNGAETIDGAATKVINTNYGVFRLYCNGANWFTW